MNFDINYTFGNKNQKDIIYNSSLDEDQMDILFQKRTVICKSLAFMLKRIFDEFNITCRVEKDVYYDLNRHVYNVIELQDGRTIGIDLEEELEAIQTRSKTKSFGVIDNGDSAGEYLLSEEELKRIDKTTAEYIPWGFYFDDMIRILKFSTNGMSTEEKLRNVLDNLDVYVADRNIGYRERTYYHNRMLQEVFTEKELKKVHQIDCYRECDGEKRYVSCIVLNQSKDDNIVYLYSDEAGKYEEIDLEKLAAEVNNGLVPMQGVQGLRKYLKSKTRREVEKEEKRKTIKLTFPTEPTGDER